MKAILDMETKVIKFPMWFVVYVFIVPAIVMLWGGYFSFRIEHAIDLLSSIDQAE